MKKSREEIDLAELAEALDVACTCQLNLGRALCEIEQLVGADIDDLDEYIAWTAEFGANPDKVLAMAGVK